MPRQDTGGGQPSATQGLRNKADLVLALLYADAGSSSQPSPVVGITRLEKLLFLLTIDEGFLKDAPPTETFSFVPFRMGPYTPEVYDEVDFLESLGLISKESSETRSATDAVHDDELFSDLVIDKYQKSAAQTSDEAEVFRLTEEGKNKALSAWRRLTEEEKAKLRRVKQAFNTMNLRQFLRYVYKKHPEYTTESEIKEYLGLRV
jgi:uncharacterized protein YwgA